MATATGRALRGRPAPQRPPSSPHLGPAYSRLWRRSAAVWPLRAGVEKKFIHAPHQLGTRRRIDYRCHALGTIASDGPADARRTARRAADARTTGTHPPRVAFFCRVGTITLQWVSTGQRIEFRISQLHEWQSSALNFFRGPHEVSNGISTCSLRPWGSSHLNRNEKQDEPGLRLCERDRLRLMEPRDPRENR